MVSVVDPSVLFLSFVLNVNGVLLWFVIDMFFVCVVCAVVMLSCWSVSFVWCWCVIVVVPIMLLQVLLVLLLIWVHLL